MGSIKLSAGTGLGFSSRAILNAVKNPKMIKNQGTRGVKHVGEHATVVLNKAGKSNISLGTRCECMEDSTMKAQMEAGLYALLREVVERHCPQYLSKLGSGDRLMKHEKFALQQATTDELLATGLREDDEPNERGLLLESLIDFLGKE